MVKFLGSALEIPVATTGTQAVRKQYVDTGDAALAARIATLEAGGTSSGGGTVSGGQTLAVKSASTAMTAVAGDFVLADASSGSFTVTLPASPPVNTAVAVKKIDPGLNLVTVTGAGTTTIDDDATCTLTQAKSGAVFVYDGTNWQVESTVIFDPGAKNFTYRGAWSNTVTYGINDVVFYNRNAYVAVLGSTGTTPATDASSATWGLLVLHGADGATGAKGDKGDTGLTGAKGDKGDTGLTGAKGDKGDTGLTGTKGDQGDIGLTGTKGDKGDTGLTGPAGTSFTYRLAWSPATTYAVNDVVTYLGSSYINLTANTGTPPNAGTTSAIWGLIAVKGTDGANGAAGSNGTNGVDGTNGTNGLSLTYKGTWAAGTAYAVNDVVSYSGSSYVNRTANTGTAPTAGSTSAIWGLMAVKGTDGTNGTNGINGTNGADGATGPAGPGFTYRGTWTSSATYAVNDVVTYLGTTYVTVVAGTTGAGNVPTTSKTTPFKAIAEGMHYYGAWSNSQVYNPGDVVNYQGSFYINTSQSTAGQTPLVANFDAMAAGLNYRGTWVSGTTYQPRDIVYYQGSSYLTVTSTSTTTAPDPASSTPFTLFSAGIRSRGAYAAGTSYVPGDVVAYSNGSYVNLTASSGTAPTVGSSNANWMLLAAQGTTGAAGTNGTSFTYKGAWASGTTYAVNDVVTSSGSSYISLTANNTGNTPTPGVNWSLMAVKGTDGSNGAAGSNGTNGLSLTYKGAWASGTSYVVNDVVYFSGSSYVNMTPTATTAPTAGLSSSYWGLMSLKGTDGAAGSSGTNGLSFTYRNAWNSGTTYAVNDVVSANGSTYISLTANNTANTPAVGASSPFWGLMALKGTDGANGTAGANGTTPVFTVTAASLPSTSPASVTPGGTATNPTLAFGIPAGPGVPAGGNPGQILTKSTATDYATTWSTPTTSSGGGLTPTAVQTSAYTAAKGDLVLANALTAGFTVTLPVSPAKGDTVAVKKTDTSANTVTVVGSASGTPTIDGDPSALLASQDSAATFVYDGTGWQVSSTAILNTSSSSGSAVASTSDGLFAPILTSGMWYDRRTGFSPANSAGGYNTTVVQMSTIFLLPAYNHKAVAIDQLALVTGGTAPTSGATVRIGVYSPTTTGAPGVLVSDFGLMNLGSAASTVITMAASGTLPKGFYYWALSFNSVNWGSLASVNQVGTVMPVQGIPIAQLTFNNLNYGAMLGPLYYLQTGNSTAAALSSTATSAAPVYIGSTNQANGIVPDVFYRAA